MVLLGCNNILMLPKVRGVNLIGYREETEFRKPSNFRKAELMKF